MKRPAYPPQTSQTKPARPHTRPTPQHPRVPISAYTILDFKNQSHPSRNQRSFPRNQRRSCRNQRLIPRNQRSFPRNRRHPSTSARSIPRTQEHPCRTQRSIPRNRGHPCGTPPRAIENRLGFSMLFRPRRQRDRTCGRRSCGRQSPRSRCQGQNVFRCHPPLVIGLFVVMPRGGGASIRP